MPRLWRTLRPSGGKLEVYKATKGYFVPWFAGEDVEVGVMFGSGEGWLREWWRVRRPGRYDMFVMREAHTFERVIVSSLFFCMFFLWPGV